MIWTILIVVYVVGALFFEMLFWGMIHATGRPIKHLRMLGLALTWPVSVPAMIAFSIGNNAGEAYNDKEEAK